MKNKVVSRLMVLALALASVFSMNVLAQTTDDGTGPSEQPDAPLETGQPAPPDANAQPPAEQPPSDMPSGEQPAQTDQGVARISYIHGDVSTVRGDSDTSSAATLNQPVVTGDKVSTGNDGRTELQLDFADVLRLAPNSQVNIATLTKKNIQIQLAQGMLDYSVYKDGEAEPEIDTPNVSVHPAHHDGVFRVEVRPDGDTVVIVRKGEAQISTPQGATEVDAGQMATIRGTEDEAQYKISDAPDRDEWDQWNNDRDRVIANAQSYKHTDRYYVGAQDLDQYGRWENAPDYGDVWVPNEPDGWVPYRDGNWVWEPYYGWTWVGYEPWGWAPYHYGRWMWYGNSWAWWPGPVYGGFYRPFWAPAYVSFFGWGGGFGFGFGWGGWGGFGWLPIGPCDRFYPWWGGYRGHFGWYGYNHFGHYDRGGFAPLHNGMRYSNLARINDAHVGRALSTMGAGRFGTHGTAVAASREQIRGARVMQGNLPVMPTRASLSASGRAASPSTIHNTAAQHFFGHSNSAVRPASFTQETSRLQQSFNNSHVSPAYSGGRGATNVNNARAGNFGKPSAGVAAREGNSAFAGRGNTGTQNANRGGFRPFSPPNSSAARSSNNSNVGTHGTAERSNGGYRPFNNNNAGRSFSNSNTGAARSGNNGYRPFTPPNNAGRSFSNSSAGAQRESNFSRGSSAPANNGFRAFTPPSRSESASPAERGGSYWNRTAPSSPARGNYSSGGGSYWNRTAPSSPARGNYGGNYGRPQLNMRQPVVQPRSYGGGYSGYGRGSYAAPSRSYGGGRPSGGFGGGRAPSGGGHFGGGGGGFHGGGGGGGFHGGGGGGGHSSGGGGSHGGGHR